MPIARTMIPALASLIASTAIAAGPEPLPLIVYRDGDAAENHGVWQTVQAPGSSATIALKDTGAPFEGSSNVRLDFQLPAPSGWAGVVVLPYPDAWGLSPGFAYDLSAARHLVFMARGANGGERIRIKAAVAGDQPFGDSAPLPFDSGWFSLTNQWQSFKLEVDGQHLSRVITPLVVICNRQHNPVGRATVHLDWIRYEAETAASRN